MVVTGAGVTGISTGLCLTELGMALVIGLRRCGVTFFAGTPRELTANEPWLSRAAANQMPSHLLDADSATALFRRARR